jgi:hypothetical protein
MNEIKKCLCCEKTFTRNEKYRMSTKTWNRMNYCSRECFFNKLPDKEYFEKKIKELYSNCKETKKGCIEWKGRVENNGYIGMCLRNKFKTGHRFVWEYFKGEIPTGMHVLHKCDNRRCINIDHLFLGTNLDNIKDMCSKNRHNNYSKLNKNKVEEVLKLAETGMIYKDIAKVFNVSRTRVNGLAVKHGIKRA